MSCICPQKTSSWRRDFFMYSLVEKNCLNCTPPKSQSISFKDLMSF